MMMMKACVLVRGCAFIMVGTKFPAPKVYGVFPLVLLIKEG
jgi:hypothetical protein